jgi:hypothetical protein
VRLPAEPATVCARIRWLITIATFPEPLMATNTFQFLVTVTLDTEQVEADRRYQLNYAPSLLAFAKRSIGVDAALQPDGVRMTTRRVTARSPFVLRATVAYEPDTDGRTSTTEIVERLDLDAMVERVLEDTNSHSYVRAITNARIEQGTA